MSDSSCATPAAPACGWAARLARGENWILVAGLTAMVLLPLAEIFFRKLFHSGIAGSQTITQHLTLLVGTIGGAVAAREGRLLAMSSLPGVLKGRWKSAAAIIAGGMSTALTVCLAVAGVQFVISERGSGNTMAYGIPIWIVVALIPAGFILVAWRLARQSAECWRGRAAAVLLAGWWFGSRCTRPWRLTSWSSPPWRACWRPRSWGARFL